MNPSWNAHCGILSQAILGDRKAWVIGWTSVALCMIALGALFAFGFAPDSRQARVVACAVPLATLALFCWMRFVPGVVRQNSPANARLVPGLHQAVRRATLLAWCLTLAPMALLATAFEHGMLVFAGLSAIVTATGIARGGKQAGTVLCILVIVAWPFVSDSADLMDRLSSAPSLALLLLLDAALAWYGFAAICLTGGDRHWKLLSGQATQRASTDMRQSMKLKRASGGRGALYALLLQRDLRPGTRPQHLLLHALGPYNHRHDLVVPLLLVALLAAAVKVATLDSSAQFNLAAVTVITSYAVPLILLQGFLAQRLVVSVENTRGEQALARLAPRLPSSPLLGRALAGQLLRICLGEWLACGLAVLALLALFGASWQQMLVPVSAMAASLSMTGWALRDHASRSSGSLFTVILQSTLVGASLIVLMLVHENLQLWCVMLAELLLVSLAIVRGRWKCMLDAPVPFPSGRFA